MANAPLTPLDKALSEFKGFSLPEIATQQTERRPSASAAGTVPADLMPSFEAAAKTHGVPINILLALADQESSFNPRAVGPTTKWGTAKGLMQYLDSTAGNLGINPYDPRQSIDGAARQLRERLDKGLPMDEAVMEHFAGPNRKQWGAKTKQYGIDVMSKAERWAQQYQPSTPAAEGPESVLAEMNKAEPGRYSIPTPEQLAMAQQGVDLAPTASPVAAEQSQDGFLSATGKALQNVPQNFKNAAGGFTRFLGEDMSAEKERSLGMMAQRMGMSLDDAKLVYWAETNGLIDPALKQGDTQTMVQTLREQYANESDPEAAMAQAQAVQQAFERGGIFSPEAVAGAGRQISKEAKDAMIDINPNGPMAKYGSMIIGSTAEMVPALVAGMITRNPNITLGMIGGQVYGQSYERAREAGDDALPPREAAAYALAQAGAEAIPSALPVGIILSQGKNFFTGLLKAGAAEAVQEGITAALQSGIDKGTIDPNMTWEEARQQIVDGIIVGAGSGVAMKAGVDGANRAAFEARGGKLGELGREMNAAVDGAEFSTTPEQQAVQALDPNSQQQAAQVQQAQAAPEVTIPINPVVNEEERDKPAGPLARALEKDIPAQIEQNALAGMDTSGNSLIEPEGFAGQVGAQFTLDIPGEGPVAVTVQGYAGGDVILATPEGVSLQLTPEDLQSVMPQQQEAAPVQETAPQVAPQAKPVREERTYDQMDEPELRERLKYLAGQAKSSGWNKTLMAERRKVEKVIESKKSETDNARSYDKRRLDRASRISNAESAADIDAVLQEEYSDNERHMDGTGFVEQAASAQRFKVESAEREARNKAQYETGEWAAVAGTGGGSKSAAEQKAAKMQADDQKSEYRAEANNDVWYVERRKKPADQMAVKDAAPVALELEAQSPAIDPEPIKWFGTQEKADNFIAKKKMAGTHEVVQEGKRFEIREKGAFDIESAAESLYVGYRAYGKDHADRRYSEVIEKNNLTQEQRKQLSRRVLDMLDAFEKRQAAVNPELTTDATVKDSLSVGQAVTLGKGQMKGTVKSVDDQFVKVDFGDRTEKMALDTFNRRLNAAKAAAPSVAEPQTPKVDRQQAITEAQGAASEVLSQGGTEAEATRAATDQLIDRMADDPSISIAQDAPAAVEAAKQAEPKWWQDSTPAQRYNRMRAAGIKGTAKTAWSRLSAADQRALDQQWGDRSEQKPVATTKVSEGVTATVINPGVGRQQTPAMKWVQSSAEDRRATLNAAGYTDGDQARAYSGAEWADLPSDVREKIEGKPAAEAPRRTAKERAEQVVGKVGDTVVPDQSFDYLTAGKPMVVDNIDRKGNVYLRDPVTGSGTQISTLVAERRGVKFEKPEGAANSPAVRSIRAGKALGDALALYNFAKVDGSNAYTHTFEADGKKAVTAVRVIRDGDEIQYQVTSVTTAMDDGRMKANAPAAEETVSSESDAVELARKWQEANRKWVKPEARRPQPGEEGYTITDARNDLMEAEAKADGMIVSDRDVQRARQLKKLVADMEAEAKKSDAPGTRYNTQADRNAADRLEIVVAEVRDNRLTPAETGAIQNIESVIAELRKPKTVSSVQGMLSSAAPRLNKNYSAQADVIYDVAEQLGAPSETAEAKPAEADLDAMFDDVLAEVTGEQAATQQPADDAAVESLEDEIRAQKKRVMRLKGGDATKLKAAEARLRRMRTGIFEAEDNLVPAARAGDAKALAQLEEMGFADTADAIRAFLPEEQRSAGDAAVSAAKNAASALDDAINGLGALFGGNGRFSSGLTFDKETYEKAKPLFISAAANVRAASKDLREAMQAVVKMVVDRFGADTAKNMKPYVVRFIEDVRDGNIQLQEQANESEQLDQRGAGSLEGVSSSPLQGAEGQEQAGRRTASGSRADARGNERAGSQRDDDARSLGSDAGAVPVSETGSRGARRTERDQQPVQRGNERDAARGTDGRRADDLKSASGTTAQQAPANFTIAEPIAQGGAKTKYKANIAAIRLLKQLEAEGRQATRDEQSTLAQYVGWGGIPQAFERSDGGASQGWTKEVAELKELLTAEEYSAAASSTKNAHYTSPQIVSAMWRAVDRLGFKGGRVLEPSVGAGNFFGLMPHELRKASALNGVELDRITSGIAAQLYPEAKVARMGFQDYLIPDGHFDIAIGNPPFGRESLYDGKRKDLSGFSIHNYFFAKSLDGLKPGGVLAMVVTNRMLDVAGDKARRYMADRADFIGAIRLPNDAFMANAGTSVTTDIIFMRKRAEGEAPAGAKWMEVRDYTDKDGNTAPLNEYFHANPQMMLGDFGAYGSMYREGEPALVAREGQDTAAELERAIASLPEGVMQAVTVKPETSATVRAENVRVGSMFLDGNAVKVRGEDVLGENTAEAVTFPNEKAKERVIGMIGLRDDLVRVRTLQLNPNASDKQIANARKALNTGYDKFVAKHGPINLDANKRLFRDDPTWPQLSALEDNFDRGISAAVAKKTGEEPRSPSASKSAIFRTRTQSPYQAPQSASSAKDALVNSLAETGRVDMGMMQRLYGKTEDAIVKELGELIFSDPVKGYVTADEYLSGNVKAKLAQARAASQNDPAMSRNVDALEAVQPADVEPVDINVKPGATWIPKEVMTDFGKTIAESDRGSALYNPGNAKWSFVNLNPSQSASQRFGTGRVTVQAVLEAAANQKTMQVFDSHADGTRTLNETETQLANEKVNAVKEQWGRWIWEDDARRESMARLYNDIFNTDVPRNYDGAHLTLPGKVGDDIVAMRPHQNNAIWRIVQADTTLTDHVVGAGKTYTLIAGAMELRRMGLAKKPMFAVPNHLVGQWAADFLKLYPNANVLAATKKDFQKENRKRLFARIATGDWDAVIVAHSSFGKVEVEPKAQAEFIEEQIADLDASIEMMREADGKNSRNVKDTQKRRDALREKLKKLTDSEAKDDNLYWGELGVDALFVDEAHEFKNLAFSTSMNRVAGLGNQTGSQKAMDMFMKVQQVLKTTGGRNVVFATGTPISNTMAEMYTMQRYLDYSAMKQQGISHFDAWARMYGEVVTDWELSPSGTYKMNSRFAKFVNMPELMQRYTSFADVINRDDINRMLASQGKKLPVPKVKGGKPNNTIVERSPDQAAYIGIPTTDENGNEEYPRGSLVWRSENLPKKAEKGADNMLKIMGDARKAALDMRLIDPSYPDFAGSKVNQAARDIKALYKQWDADRGVQLVFIDLSTPKNAKAGEAARLRDLVTRAEQGDEAAAAELDKVSPDEMMALDSDFSVYDDLKQKLIADGIPEAEIAFIHDAKTELQKEEMFGKVRSGRIRVLLGSTAKMGAGMNVQDRLVALHHLDAPWRPSDLEQREGRIIRQGNKLYERDPEGFEVVINRYATKQTLDSRMWQTIEGKAKFIEQVRKGNGSREVEDVAGEAANSAEMKAASSGNPLILEEMSLRQTVRKLETERSGHDREQHRLKASINQMQDRADWARVTLDELRKDIKRAQPADFAMTIDGATYDKRKDAGEALLAKAAQMEASKTEEADVGNYGDFSIKLERIASERFSMILDGSGTYGTHLNIGDDPVGVSMRLTNRVKDLAGLVEEAEQRIAKAKAEIPKLQQQVQEWSKDDELTKAKARHSDVIEQLKPKRKEVQTAPEVKASVAEDMERAMAMTEDEYIAAVNPEGKKIDADDRMRLDYGDLETPANARPVETFKDKKGRDVIVLQDADGIMYAQVEGKTAGMMGPYEDGETVIDLVEQEKGAGIGTGLVKAYLRQNPLAPSGGFSPAGEATRRAAFRALKAERSSNTGITVDALQGVLRGGQLGSVLGRMIDNGSLVLHATTPAGINPDFQGWTDRAGKMHLVASKLTQANAMPVLLHEAFHSGGRALLKNERWKNLMARLNGYHKALEAGRMTGEWADAFRRVQNAKAAGDTMSRIRLIEELGAYAVENYERAPAGIKKWVDGIIGAVKEFLYRRFGIQAGQVTPAQLRAMAAAALRSGSTSPRGTPSASRQEQTETEAFKRWFGDSKVVDADGKPLMVYHGSAADFDSFDLAYANQDDPDVPVVGFHLSNDEGRARGAKPEQNRQFYVSIKNPATTTRAFKERRRLSNALGRTPSNKEVTDSLIAKGYDGVFMSKPWAFSQEDIDRTGRSLTNPGADNGYELVKEGDEYGLYSRGNHSTSFESVEEANEIGSEFHVVAFRPEQIKSATGNRGTFDPANPDIRASVPDAPSDAQVEGWFSRKLTDAMSGPKSKGQYSLLALAPMDRMIEEMGKANLPAQEYMKLKRDMDAYRTEKHTEFDATAQKWLKLNLFDRKSAQELAGIMHDATIAQTDPAEPFKSSITKIDNQIMATMPDSEDGMAAFAKKAADEQRRATHKKLRAEFLALPAAFQAQYLEVRDTYQKMSEELDQIIMDNLAAAIDIHGHKAERVYYKELAEIRDEGLKGAEKEAAEANALRKYNTAMTKQKWNKKARMTQLRQQFESNRLEGPYFPLARFGDYFVTVRDKDTGEVISFSRFERRADQLKFAADVKGMGKVQTGLLSNDTEIKGAVDPRFVSDIETILGGAEVPDSVKDQVWQRYLESMPDMSMRKGFIHRKNREGFSQDALRAFASRMFHGAHQMGRLKFGARMQESLEQAQEVARKTKTPERDMALVNEINRRHDYVMNPKGGAFAQHLTSAAFLYQLSMSPAAALVNISQTIMLGIPIIGAKYGNAKTSAALAVAAKDFTAGRGRADRSKSLNQDERNAMRAAYDAGLIESTNSHNLAGVGETGVEYSAVRNKVMGFMAWMFHQAERFNREVTYLAAYRLAKEKGLSQELAVREAISLTYKVHFDYGNTNRPRAMHGDTAKVALVFGNYQINMLYRLFRDTHQAFGGETKAERREAIHQLAGITGLMSLSAGVKGVWGYGLAMELASIFFGDDAEEEFKKGTIELLGPTAAGFLLNGVPGHVFDINLSSRIGMPDLWFRSPDRQLEGADEFNYWQSQLLGFLPAMAGNMFRGYTQIQDGKVYRGIETASPKFIKDLMRAGRFAQEGATNMRGDALVSELKPGELIAQMMGFTPAVVSEQYERNSALINAERRIMDARRQLMDRYAVAHKQGDTEETQKIREDIKAFNQENREVRITPDSIRQSLRSRQRYTSRTEGGVTLNPKLDRRLRDNLGDAIYQ